MGPPTERSTYHHGDLRNALLEASARLIAEQGVEGFSLREAARAVGVSPNAAYRHFADKTALVAEVAADGFARMARHMERAMAGVDAPAGSAAHAAGVLAAIGEAYVDFAVHHPARFRVMFGPWIDEAACDRGVGDSGKAPYELLVDALDALVQAHVIPADRREGAEIAAWAAVHGLASLLVEGSLPLTGRERQAALRRVLATVFVGLGGDARLVPGAERVDVDPRKYRRPSGPRER